MNRKTLLLILYIFCLNGVFSQNSINFEVTINTKKLNENGNEYFQQENFSKYFFEDENYIVNSECNGEFGGEVSFLNKKNGKLTFCEATCPVIINKLNDSYFLTTNLNHLLGSYGFYEISNPNDLTEKVSDTIHYRKHQRELGVKPLLKDYRKSILVSFVYKYKIYHIVSNSEEKETYVAVRENTELKKIQTITNKYLYNLSNETKMNSENHYFTLFYSEGKQGYIEIYKNSITLTNYE